VFDAEGVPRRRVELVDGGRAVGLLHDRRTAAAAGAASSGHSSGRDAWGPAPAALFVAPDPGGPADAAGLAERVERGLLVTTFNYCRVLDPKTLVVTGLTRNGVFLIENGRVGPPVSNLRFTQSFLEALGPGRVGGVASAARLADEEFGVGLVTAPAMHLRRWRFTGGAAG
ncbi:MAG: metallopeptidase TldD-related protein, partial [Acidimicrobiales bacterium]